MTKPFKIELIDTSNSRRTQFRRKGNPDRIKEMAELIDNDTKWTTPIRIAKFEDEHRIADGHHRVAAYKLCDRDEIPEGNYEIIECKTEREFDFIFLEANETHGMESTDDDREEKVAFLVEHYPDEFRTKTKVKWEEIAKVLKLSDSKAKRAVEKKNAELKALADALLEKLHVEGGHSVDDIAGATGWSPQSVRDKIKALTSAQISQAAKSVEVDEEDYDDEEDEDETPIEPADFSTIDASVNKPTQDQTEARKLKNRVRKLRKELAAAEQACIDAGIEVPAK